MDDWTVGPDGAIAPVYRLQQVLQARLGGIGACRNIHNTCPVTLEAVNDQLGRRRERIPRQQVVHHRQGHGADGKAAHRGLRSRAAGFNIRWLLRAIAAKGLGALLLALSQWALYAACIKAATSIRHRGDVCVKRQLAWSDDQRACSA